MLLPLMSWLELGKKNNIGKNMLFYKRTMSTAKFLEVLEKGAEEDPIIVLSWGLRRFKCYSVFL